MRLFKWSPTFDFRHESVVVPIWFKIHGVPSQWFDLRSLKTIARLVGNFVKVDNYTLNRSKMSFARLCVSVNLEVDLTTKINLSADDVITEYDIEYEKIPKYCQHYRHIGHDIFACYIKNPGLKPAIFAHKNSKIEDPEDPTSSSHEEMGNKNVTTNQDTDNHIIVTDLSSNCNPNEPNSSDNGDLDIDTEGGGAMTIFAPKDDNLNEPDANLFDVQVDFTGEQLQIENLEPQNGETDACEILSESNDEYELDTGGGSDRSSHSKNSPLKQSFSDTNVDWEDLIDKNFFKGTG
ncbi:hypothetical protein OROHE_018019 [Orobanche hederae]